MAVKAVSVVFQAFTDKFESGVKRSTFSMGSFMSKAVGMIGTYVSLRGAINNITEQMKKLDDYGKISDRLSIDPNTIRGLDLAATQTGTSFAAVETGINKMVKLIGEAEMGITTGTLALKELNLTAEEFDGLTTEERFMRMANSIAAIESPSQRAATAMKIFGRGGADLINILSQGEEGIKAYIEEAERIGGGKLFREDIKQIEAANDAIDKMGRSWETIWQQLAINLAPIIEDIADLITNNLTVAVDTMKASWDNVANVILLIDGLVSETADNWKVMWGEMGVDEAIQRNQERWEQWRDAVNIDLGGRGDFNAATSQTPTAQIAENFKPQNLKSFMEAAAAQSSRAFDILNPDRSTTQKDIADATKRTANAVEKLADKDAVTLVQEDI